MQQKLLAVKVPECIGQTSYWGRLSRKETQVLGCFAGLSRTIGVGPVYFQERETLR